MKHGKPQALLEEEMLAYFYRMNLITGEPLLVKSGKEATVYRCAAHPSTGRAFLAAKFYRPRRSRGFQNDAVYREGRGPDHGSLARAVKARSRFGREAEFAMWLGRNTPPCACCARPAWTFRNPSPTRSASS